MLTIEIELLNNCYAACPWDAAHVEGIVEWPPSPWRIYRAIFAGFFMAFDTTNEEIEQSQVEEIIFVLSQTLPSYYLPHSAYVQTRTFRKDITNDTHLFELGKKLISGELRFHPSDSAIYVFWSVELNESQQKLLSICLSFCGYIGRRESDAVWRINKDKFPQANCYYDPKGHLKTLVPADDFEPKHLFKSPREIFDLKRRQSVPGAKWTTYTSDDLKPVVRTDLVEKRFNYVKVALIANFPLRDRDTLYFSKKLHQTLVSKCSSSNFTGCDRDQHYLLSNHHVYLIPVTERGQIIAFEIYSHSGFSMSEELALIALKKLYFRQEREVVLKIVAMGKLSDYAPPSKIWQSITPMFLPRYPATLRGKPRMLQQSIYQKDGAEHQALKLLLHLPQFEANKGKNIEYKPTGLGLEQWIDGELFCRSRATVFSKYLQWKSDGVSGKKAVPEGYSISLSFARPQLAPIALGYAAHSGLGVLVPIDKLIVGQLDFDDTG